MAAAISIESDTCPVHPNSQQVIYKSLASLRDSTPGKRMLPSTESAGAVLGTFGTARPQSRTPPKKPGNDKQVHTSVQVWVWTLWWRNQRKTIQQTGRWQREALGLHYCSAEAPLYERHAKEDQIL